MKSGFRFDNYHTLMCAGISVFTLGSAVRAAPNTTPVSSVWLAGKESAIAGPSGKLALPVTPDGPAVRWLDEATKARIGSTGTIRRSADGGVPEALVFHQPNHAGTGFFEKSYPTAGFPGWATRMQFGGSWVPGSSISSYELTIFHSFGDDINHGDSDFMVELWDGDPASLLETTCTTGGVSAPIPGT